MHIPHILTALIHSITQHALNEARKAHVDPKSFLIVYACHYAVVWPLFGWIVVAFRRKQSIATPVISWIVSMLIPWIYLLIFGRPQGYQVAVIVGVMLYVVWHGYHNIRKRLAKERAKLPSTEVTVEETA